MAIKIRRPVSGYTMIEVMITVAIVGIISSMGAVMFVQMSSFYSQSTARTDVQRELRVALSNMDRRIRVASAKTINISSPAGQPPYSKIQFVDVNGSTVTFSQSGTNLVQTVGNGSVILSKHLQYVAFTYPATDNYGVMSISLTFQEATYLGRSSALQMAVSKVRVMNP